MALWVGMDPGPRTSQGPELVPELSAWSVQPHAGNGPLSTGCGPHTPIIPGLQDLAVACRPRAPPATSPCLRGRQLWAAGRERDGGVSWPGGMRACAPTARAHVRLR